MAATYVAAGKVTALQHELGDDAVELGVLVAKALLAGAQGAEVLDRLGDDVVEELKVDAAGLLCGSSMSAIVLVHVQCELWRLELPPRAGHSSAARHGGAAHP